MFDLSVAAVLRLGLFVGLPFLGLEDEAAARSEFAEGSSEEAQESVVASREVHPFRDAEGADHVERVILGFFFFFGVVLHSEEDVVRERQGAVAEDASRFVVSSRAVHGVPERLDAFLCTLGRGALGGLDERRVRVDAHQVSRFEGSGHLERELPSVATHVLDFSVPEPLVLQKLQPRIRRALALLRAPVPVVPPVVPSRRLRPRR
mmetsp:Transcript_10436/g.31486  ORF Transcript_10436/g.31486 Transcript_10436/m.31486 type:complete len:206 (+) Transcript_10436:542-1159(+)